MTRLLACISFMVLTVLVQFYTAHANIFKQQKDGEPPKGCLLQANMMLEYCLTPAEAEKFRDTMYNKLSHLKSVRLKMPRPDDLSTGLSKHGEDVRVENGAVCMVSPNSGDTSVYICKHGSWMASRAFMVMDNKALSKKLGKSRKKRRTIVPVVVTDQRRVCSGWLFGKKCHTENYVKIVNNVVPEITCPHIPDVVAALGYEDAYVTWSSATATDEEDGKISTRQTVGPRRSTRLGAGTYTVTYEAKDSKGTSAYCSTTFKVEVLRCPSYYCKNDYTRLSWTYLENGRVSCTKSNLWGSSCTFTCNTGYELDRGNKLTCQRNKEWDYARPSCIRMKCSSTPSVLNGMWSCGDMTVGSTCALSCEYGYAVEGQSRITCLSTMAYSSPGSCKDVMKPQISCPQDLTTFSQPKGQPTRVNWSPPSVFDNSGQRVTVSSGFTSEHLFPVGRTEVTFTATDTSSNTASCTMTVTVILKECATLPALEHGEIHCSHSASVGSECTFTCSDGFSLLGDSTRTCRDAQQWSGRQPICERQTCSAPDSVSHGSFSCPNTNFNYQDTCTLSCEAGYTAQPPLTITCNSALQWSNAGSCKDTTSPQFLGSCSNVREYADSSGGTYIEYTLPEVRDNSGEPVQVTSSPPSGSLFQPGKTSVTVVARDNQGNEERCVFTVEILEIMCPDPHNANIDDSKKGLMQFSCPDGHVVGAKCDVSCSDNNPVNGQSTIRCVKNGATVGSWFYGNDKPFCEEESCPLLVTPDHGSISCDSLGDREFCTVQCRDGYTYTGQGDALAVCKARDGVWLPPDITTMFICLRGATVEDVKFTSEIYYYSNSCSQDNAQIASNFFRIINASTLFSDLCTTQNIACKVGDVKITCGDGDRPKRSVRNVEEAFRSFHSSSKLRSKRSIGVGAYTVKVAFVVAMPYKSQGSARDTKRLYNRLAYELNYGFAQEVQEGKFDMPDVGQTDDQSYHYGAAKYICAVPKVYQSASGYCVGCGKGHIYLNTSQSCSVCPKGTYQPYPEATECLQCPDMYTTKEDGAVSEDECLPVCAPGSYSKDGTTPCDLCPRGTYQYASGSTKCQKCYYGMSTIEAGATGRGNQSCEFYEIRLSNSTVGPLVNYNAGPGNFTLWTWVNIPSNLLDTRTSFSFRQREGAASLGFGEFQIYIHVEEDWNKQNRRGWYHISVVKTGSLLELYINGKVMENKTVSSNLPPRDDLRISFTPGNNLEALTISEMQLGSRSIGNSSSQYPVECGGILPDNYLYGEETDQTLTTLSKCDDHDGCTDSPCGSHGTCIDTEQSFRCFCNDFWSGDRCQTTKARIPKEDLTAHVSAAETKYFGARQIAPDLCTPELCSNGASCVSASDGDSFECLCNEGYMGKFCEEKIVDGGWDEWSAWSSCSRTCGGGTKSRERTCDNPPPGPGGRPCVGKSQETSNCSTTACPVDGGFSEWTKWECSVTCGNGTSQRTRTCDNPAPAHGGEDCMGSSEEVTKCSLGHCPVDGGFSDWSEWSECSQSCGGGFSYRTRECNFPAPQYGGANCSLENYREIKSCNGHVCPRCPELIGDGENVNNLECENENDDMKVCSRVCKKGYFTAGENDFVCGRLSNYTWSLVTKDNPRGLLPSCAKAEVPESRTFIVYAYFYIGIFNESGISEEVRRHAENVIQCETCSVDVSTAENSSINRKKRSTGFTNVILRITTPSPNPAMDMEKADDEEMEEQYNALYELESAADAIVNNSVEVFSVQQNGQIFTADVESVRVEMDFSCPEGMQRVDLFCVQCGRGTYWVSNTCEKCPEGYYQDKPKMSSCEKCPDGTSTAGKGAQSLEHCVEDPSVYFPKELGYWDDPDDTDYDGDTTTQNRWL